MSFVFSENQRADGVLAVVGNRAVLASDVLEETSLVAQQQNISPEKNPYLYDRLFTSVLNKQINKNIVLFYALQDSLLEVSYDDINKTLDERLAFYVAQFGSEEAFEEKTSSTLEEMKRQHWDNIKNEILIEKFKVGLLRGVSITKYDVFDFYNAFKDSLPSSPSLVSFSLLQKTAAPSSAALSSFLQNINTLRDSLVLGELNFTEVALLRSQDPGVRTNKGIMETVRGDLVSEYERTAYSLKEGEIGKLTKTKFGYHLIKLLKRVGEKTTTQHILFNLPTKKEDVASSLSFLDSVRVVFKNDPGVFDSLSVALSDVGSFSGYFEDYNVKDINPLFFDFLTTEKNFSFSAPFEKKGVCYLVYKYSFTPSKKTNLEDNWSLVESFALNKKREDVFNLWIDEKKDVLFLKTNNLY